MVVFSDFDGTISKQDSLKSLLVEFGGEAWKATEAKMLQREISERDALSMCFEGFSISPAQAYDWVLENVELDEGFLSFVSWCRDHDYPLVVLSGGFKEFVEAVFEREGVKGLPVFANSLDLSSEEWKIKEKQGPRLCSLFSHCKCSSLMKDSGAYPSVYIGDGLTDSCVAERADLVFAKSWLKKHLTQKNLSFTSFQNFYEVEAQLSDWDRRRAMAPRASMALSKVTLDRHKV